MKKPYSTWDFVIAYIDRMMLLRFFKTFWRIGITPLAFWYFWNSGHNFLYMLLSMDTVWGYIANIVCTIGLLYIMVSEFVLTLVFLTTKSDELKDSYSWLINGPVYFLSIIVWLLTSIFWFSPRFLFRNFRKDVEKFQVEYEKEMYLPKEFTDVNVLGDQASDTNGRESTQANWLLEQNEVAELELSPVEPKKLPLPKI